MNYRERLEIDLADLSKRVISKWYIILTCSVLGGIFGIIVGHFYAEKIVIDDASEEVSISETDIENLRNAITENSAVFVEDIARQYEIEYEEYVNFLDQVDSFPSVNEGGIFSISKLYLISDFVCSTCFLYTPNVENSISDTSDSTFSEIGINNNYYSYLNNITIIYKNELLSNTQKAKIADVTSVDISNVEDLINISIVGDSILSLTVYAEDEETANSLMDIVTGDFDVVTDKIKNIYYYNISYIGSDSSYGEDEYIITLKYNYIQKLNQYKNGIVSLTSSMTTDEKAYFNALINNQNDVVEDSIDEVDVSDTSTKVQETVVARSIDKKYAIAGIIGGLFISVLVFALKYILSSKLHTADDLRNAFGLSVLGEVTNDSINVDVICQEMLISATKHSVEIIYLMGASDDEISNKNRKDIKDNMILEKGIKTIKIGSSALNDSKTMKELSESDAVVLVERVGYSSYDDIAREIELCNKFEIKILGAVVVG